MPLPATGNYALKMRVDRMSAERKPSGEPLAAKTIVDYVATVKLVVASAINAEGELLYSGKWNDEFIGVPIVEKDKQHRQTVTGEETADIVSRSKGRYRVLFATLPGTGVRIGQGLALKPEDFSSLLRDSHHARNLEGKGSGPEDAVAIRDIDVPEELAAMVCEYVATIPAGHYLFATARGKPMSQRNVLRMLHSKRKVGFHAFRRFRASVLRKAGGPGDLEKLWLGHASRSVTDDYARQLREDLPFMQEWAERAGLGFSMSQTEDVLPCSTGIVCNTQFQGCLTFDG